MNDWLVESMVFLFFCGGFFGLLVGLGVGFWARDRMDTVQYRWRVDDDDR